MRVFPPLTLRDRDRLARGLGLSGRYPEIVAYLLSGSKREAIALALCMKIGTLRKDMERVYSRLDVHSRLELIAEVLDRCPWARKFLRAAPRSAKAAQGSCSTSVIAVCRS